MSFALRWLFKLHGRPVKSGFDCMYKSQGPFMGCERSDRVAVDVLGLGERWAKAAEESWNEGTSGDGAGR